MDENKEKKEIDKSAAPQVRLVARVKHAIEDEATQLSRSGHGRVTEGDVIHRAWVLYRKSRGVSLLEKIRHIEKLSTDSTLWSDNESSKEWYSLLKIVLQSEYSSALKSILTVMASGIRADSELQQFLQAGASDPRERDQQSDDKPNGPMDKVETETDKIERTKEQIRRDVDRLQDSGDEDPDDSAGHRPGDLPKRPRNG